MELDSTNEAFWAKYAQLCLKAKICPLKSVVRYLKGTELCCPVENVRQEHWKYLLSALCTDNTLTTIHFASGLLPLEELLEVWEKERKKFPLPYGVQPINVSNICESISCSLPNSNVLRVLKLENLYLTTENANILSKGLRVSCIEHFSIARCQISEEAVEIICRGLYLSEVSWVDFSSCSLSIPALKAVSYIIKSHKIRRKSEMFPNSLRQRMPALDSMKGLTRVSLNDNVLGSQGIALLVEVLEDDLWIKALDLQMCSIDDKAAQLILDFLPLNNELEWIDLRQNEMSSLECNRDTYVKSPKLEMIGAHLAQKTAGKTTKYSLGALWNPMKSTGAIFKRKVAKPKVLRKVAKCKTGRKDFKSIGNAIRISYSIIGDEGVFMKDQGTQIDNGLVEQIKIISEAYNKEVTMQKCMMHLIKKSRAENQLLRQELEKVMKEEDGIYIDNETFLEVKNTFEKFKTFLEIMKEYGLWEFISMIGTNENIDVILEPLLDDTRSKMKIVKKVARDRHCDNPCPSKAPPPVPVKQRCCSSCRIPDCNLRPKEASKLSYELSKAAAQKVFKEVKQTYSTGSSSSAQYSGNPSGNLPRYSSPKSSMKKLYKMEVPDKLKQFKSPKELYAAVKKDLATCDACKVHHRAANCTSNKIPDPPLNKVMNSLPENVIAQSSHPVASNSASSNNASIAARCRETHLQKSPVLQSENCSHNKAPAMCGACKIRHSATNCTLNKVPDPSTSKAKDSLHENVFSQSSHPTANNSAYSSNKSLSAEFCETSKQKSPTVLLENSIDNKALAMCGACKMNHGATNCTLSKIADSSPNKAKNSLPENVFSQTSHPSASHSASSCSKSLSDRSHETDKQHSPTLQSENSSNNRRKTKPRCMAKSRSVSNPSSMESNSLPGMAAHNAVLVQNLPENFSFSTNSSRNALSEGGDSPSTASHPDSSQPSVSPSKSRSIASSKSSSSTPSKSYLETVSDMSTSERSSKTFIGSDVSKSEGISGTNPSPAVHRSVESPEVSGSKDSQVSNHSKSSKKSRSQKKSEKSLPKKCPSEPSLPSLSDITTVSSGSLNTDSVMNKLSES